MLLPLTYSSVGSKVKGQMMGQIDAGLMPDYNTLMGFKKLPT